MVYDIPYPPLYVFSTHIWTCLCFINFVCPSWLLGWTKLNGIQKRALTFLVWFLVLRISEWIVDEYVIT